MWVGTTDVLMFPLIMLILNGATVAVLWCGALRGHDKQEQQEQTTESSLGAVVYVRISDDGGRRARGRPAGGRLPRVCGRARLVGRSGVRGERTRREYAAIMPEQTGSGIDVTTVAAEWKGRTPMWQFQATSLILEAVLVYVLPDGINGATPACRRNETVEAFHARREAYRAGLLAQRVELVWRA